MKKFISVLIAATVLAAPLAQAQSRNEYRPDQGRHGTVERKVIQERKVTTERNVVRKQKHRWERGQRVSSAERRHVVDQRDYRRHKLSAPKRDQRWVRVDDQFLLINAVTGLIVGLAAAR